VALMRSKGYHADRKNMAIESEKKDDEKKRSH
jgi:hypothetical protein